MESTGGLGMRRTRPTGWALGFAALTLLLRLPFLRLPFDPTDEGYYAAVAQSSVRGSRLYADLWYVRPPFLNVVYAWSYRFSLGTAMPYDDAVRVFSAVFVAATVGVLAWVLFSELAPRAAILGAAMAALLAASLSLQNEANAETWMLLPYAASALLVLHVALHDPPNRRALWALALAGALTGVAAGFKQVALVNLALPIVTCAVFDRRHIRRWIGRTCAFIAGTAAVWAGILIGLGFLDDVRAFLYYAWFRNMVYVRASRAGSYSIRAAFATLTGPLAAFSLSLVVVLALFAFSLSRNRAWTRSPRIGVFSLAWLGVSAIGVAASGRFYPHYFVQTTIPLALLLAASVDTVFAADARARTSTTSFALIAVLTLLCPTLSYVADLRDANSIAAQRQLYKDLAQRELPRLTPPGGSFLVWGISVSVNAYTPLQAASRLPVVAYDYGWTPTDRGRLLGEEFPSTADVVLAELRQREPDTVLLTVPLNASDASIPHNDGVRLTSALYALLAEHYTVVERGTGYVVLTHRR